MKPCDAQKLRLRLEVTGTVQGVGFRPFVARTAMGLKLSGWVANRADGVQIEAEGEAGALAALCDRIEHSPPGAARIASLSTTPIPVQGGALFAIAASLLPGDAAPVLQPDRAPCSACRAELGDPDSRRHGYPFISCAECGPRYSIADALPFDRERTSFNDFPLCPRCAAEYGTASDRRFDAQTISCPDCGPCLALLSPSGECLAERDEALALALDRLHRGEILALKGVGGYQLLVDARSAPAVMRLRARKLRPSKPLALMVADLAMLRSIANFDAAEEALLGSPAAPIVLLAARPGGLPDAIAPGLARIGAMLPASGLHALIAEGFGAPLVVTSGNRPGEPIALDEEDALAALAGIADAFLIHDRRIAARLDDSLTQIAAGLPQVLRRARGYVPEAIALAGEAGDLALGGQQKSAIALGLGRIAVPGPHLGELDHAGVRAAHRAASERLCALYRSPPRRILIDAHPDYAASVHGAELATRLGLPLAAIWHHVAHVHAVIAEHDLALPLTGLAWDGLGLGENRTLRGGEAFRVDEEDCLCVASLAPFPLPGGEVALREPRRAALGLLYAALGDKAFEDRRLRALFSSIERPVLVRMLARGINSPLCTSIGRLFDAIAALLGLCPINRHEGEAAMRLQGAAEEALRSAMPTPRFELSLEGGTIQWRELALGLIAARDDGIPTPALALAFHQALARIAVGIAHREALPEVVLSGGCFQNRLLLELCVEALRAAGLRPHWGQRIPCNDEGLALGQLGAARFSHFAWQRESAGGR